MDESAPALTFAARSLPALRRVRLHSHYRASLAAAELLVLAAVTRLHSCKVNLLQLPFGSQCSARQRTARAAQDWSALAALTSLRCLSLTCCGTIDASVRTLSAQLPHMHTLSLQHNGLTGVQALAAATALTSLTLHGDRDIGRSSGLSEVTRMVDLQHLNLRMEWESRSGPLV